MREAPTMVGDNGLHLSICGDKGGEIVVHGAGAYMHKKLLLPDLL